MADTGTGTMTPVSGGGAGGGPDFAQPLQRTILSLPSFAAIMGLNPPHFSGGFGQTVFPVGSNCDDVWPRYPWQASDRISLSELADTIYNVEEEIANYLGYYPGPKWIAKEMHPYPRHHRRDVYGLGSNSRGQYKSVITKKGKFIQAGQRAVTLLDDSVAVVYSDESGSGINDTATITVATSLTDECEINAYFAGTGGALEWEIRPARSKTISGGNVILVYDSWLLLDPDLLAAYPTTAGFDGLDLATSTNFVAAVDVYREYTDTTTKSAEFSWEPKPLNALLNTVCASCGGTGCAACANTTQDGCLHIRDVDRGIAVPTPATYDEDEESWSLAQWSECREPDTVKIWYYAGDLDERFLRGESCERLSKYYAQAIAWMASARLERPPCGCQNIRAMFNDLRRDLAFSGTGEGDGSYFISPEDLNNPFGTRKGEVMAWRKLGKLTERIPDFAVV